MESAYGTDTGARTTRRYTPDERAQAGRLVRQMRAERGVAHGCVERVAEQLSYGTESVRNWVRQADVDDGVKPGTTTAEAERIKALEQEVKELRRANAILKSASFFLDRARPSTEVIVDYIDCHRKGFGVEPICDALQFPRAPTTRPRPARPRSGRGVTR